MYRSFPDVLKILMKKNNITQEILGEALDTTRQCIASYLAGKTEPSLSKIRKMAVFFNVSTDYLCGMQPPELLRSEEVYTHLKDLMKQNRVTQAQLAQCTGKTERSIRNKLAGRQPFTLEEAIAIRNRFFPDEELEALFNRGE